MAPIYGYVPLSDANFFDYFTSEYSYSHTSDDYKMRQFTVYHKLTVQAKTSYGLENVSFRAGKFGTISMPSSGYVSKTYDETIYKYNSESDVDWIWDISRLKTNAILSGKPTIGFVSGKLRMSWQEAESINQNTYQQAVNALSKGSNDKAIELFSLLSKVDYKDSAAKLKEARAAKSAAEKTAAEKLQQERETQYNSAIASMEAQDYTTAIPVLEKLAKASYKDSSDKLVEAQNGEKQQRYEAADALLAQGDSAAAMEAFKKLAEESFSDAATRVKMIHYANAEQLLAEGKYQEAYDEFTAANVYADAATRAKEAKYLQAETYMAAGDYQKASDAFDVALNYKDAPERKKEANYQLALGKETEADYHAAHLAFTALGNYKDSAEKASLMYMRYVIQQAEVLIAEDKYKAAMEKLAPLAEANPEAKGLYWKAAFREYGTEHAMSAEGTGWVSDHNGRQALIDYHGNVLVTSKYEHIGPWVDGYAVAGDAKYLGGKSYYDSRAGRNYYDTQGRLLFDEELIAAENFCQGKAMVTKADGKTYVIDTTGTAVCELPTKEGRRYLHYVGENLISFANEKYKYGLIDLTGKIVLAAKCYREIKPFTYGLTVIEFEKGNKNVQAVINAKGKEVVISGKYWGITILGENIIAAKKANDRSYLPKLHVMNLKGVEYSNTKVYEYGWDEAKRQGNVILLKYSQSWYAFDAELKSKQRLYGNSYTKESASFDVGYQGKVFLQKVSSTITLKNEEKNIASAFFRIRAMPPMLSPESPYIVWRRSDTQGWVIMDSDGNILY